MQCGYGDVQISRFIVGICGLLDYIGFYWELYRTMLRIACTEQEKTS